MIRTDGLERGTADSVALDADVDYVTVRMVPSHSPTSLMVTLDEAFRYRRMIRRINQLERR